MDVFGKRNTPKLKDSIGRKQKQDSEVRKLYFDLWVYVSYLIYLSIFSFRKNLTALILNITMEIQILTYVKWQNCIVTLS